MSLKTISTAIITGKIFLIRSRKVMVDQDLAQLYGVPTKSLNLAVKRNMKRFPIDFMFQLTSREAETLRFQFETSKGGHGTSSALRSQIATSKRGGRRYLPYVFTEQGVAMLSSVLNSERAVEVNIIIMRTFVKIREILMNHKELALKLNEMEQKLAEHDKEIIAIFQVIRRLITEDKKPKGKMGFYI